LPHCSDALLVKVLPRLVMHSLWRSVSKVLEKDVSDETFGLVVQEASEHTGDEAFLVAATSTWSALSGAWWNAICGSRSTQR
jgi:hypothetical protein